jgi:hypothetical protein
MKLVFVIGKYNAPTVWEREQNIRLAESVGLMIARMGAMPIIPHSMTRFFFGSLSESFWIEGLQTILLRADAAFCLDNWVNSPGSKEEHTLAVTNGIPVFYTFERIKEWIDP